VIETLPRREREVFETLCRLGEGATSAVRTELADPLSDSAVRTLLSRLESKRLVERVSGPGGVVYRPVPRTETLADSAMRRMVDTFFSGSAASAATALLGLTKKLTPAEAAALRRAIDQAGEEG
jgi:predicted transcriptional regulator